MQKSIDWQIQPAGPASAALAALDLVDHHVHGVVREDPSVQAFSNMITESDRPPTSLVAAMNSQVGFAVRRWCSPLLDLPAHSDPETYFSRRIELGADEVNKRLLQASGISHYFVETGYRGNEIYDPAGMAKMSGVKVDAIIRMETVAERVALEGVSAADFLDTFKRELASEAKSAIGLKSIVAYRIGLDFDPTNPSESEVLVAATAWRSITKALAP